MSGLRPKSAAALSRPALHSPRKQCERPKTPAGPSTAKASETACPLNDPSIGVIGMTDHLARRCLCKYCTCGQHKCPGTPYLDPYPTSMYSTQYKAKYQPGQTSQPIRAALPYHRVNVNEMEFLTQYEKEYRPFRVETTGEMYRTDAVGMMRSGSEAQMRSRPNTAGVRGGSTGAGGIGGSGIGGSGIGGTGAGGIGAGGIGTGGYFIQTGGSPQANYDSLAAGPQARFLGSSSYNVDYPDWGGSKPYHIKRAYEAVPTKDMKFDGTSKYREAFVPVTSMSDLRPHLLGPNARNNLSLHGSGVKLAARTTHQTAFQPFPKGAGRSASFKSLNRILSATGIPGMYLTEYRDKYVKGTQLWRDPQTVGKQLAAKAQ